MKTFIIIGCIANLFGAISGAIAGKPYIAFYAFAAFMWSFALYLEREKWTDQHGTGHPK